MDFQDENKLKFLFKMGKIANFDRNLPIFFLMSKMPYFDRISPLTCPFYKLYAFYAKNNILQNPLPAPKMGPHQFPTPLPEQHKKQFEVFLYL